MLIRDINEESATSASSRTLAQKIVYYRKIYNSWKPSREEVRYDSPKINLIKRLDAREIGKRYFVPAGKKLETENKKDE